MNPPFSVECWFFPTNLASEDIWAQCGDEGLNYGGTAGGNKGTLAGVRLVWMNGKNTGFQIYNLDGSQYSAGFAGDNDSGTTSAYPTNNWYHLVLICDANTNFSLYVNGNPVSLANFATTPASGPGTYSPDYWTPLTIGGGRGGTRACAGYIDEVAVYTNMLGDPGTHYADGISGAAGAYVSDVLNDNPVIYLRMDAPAAYTPPDVSTWPALTNYGMTNGVAVGNGVYTPGTMPGLIKGAVVNPNGVPFGGVSTNFAALSGISSFADAGYAAAYDPTGAVPFSITALFRGNPCDNRFQNIVGHSNSSWRISMNTDGALQCTLGSDSGSVINSAGVYNDGDWHQVVEVYTPASAPNVMGTNALYVDGMLDTSVSTVSTNGIGPGSPDDVLIGSDPQYTNNPAGAGRQFAGQICDVALFNQALTSGQIQMLYSNCEVLPYITGQPVTGRTINGGTGTYIDFGVLANGSPTLDYQWYFNTSSNYNGATKLVDGAQYTGATTLEVTVTNLTAADSGYYFAVITNNYGSVTSILASLTVNTAATINGQFPVPYTNLFTLYAGASPTFSISAAGAQPITYFWYTNGILDAAATGSSMVWTNAQAGSITNYCIVTNVAGSATSMVWTATVLAAPTAPYPTNVLADNPIGYWRLNEPDDGQSDGNPGAIALDYAGGNDAIYTNVLLGQTGYSPSTDPSDTSAIFGEYGSLPANNEYAGQIQGIDFAVTNGANGEFTVEAWANGINSGSFPQTLGAPLATKGIYGVDDQFNLGIDTTKTHYRFYVRDASGTIHVVGSASQVPLDNNWHHLAGVCDEANGRLMFYGDGKLLGTTSIPTNSGIYETPEPMTIGAGTADGVTYGNQFIGNINDVAVYNYALSIGQITAQYSSVTGIQPYFTQTPPSSMTVNAGDTLVLPAGAAGTTPLGYYWTDVNGGTNVAADVTNGLPLNATLTVSNVPAAWNNEQLQLTVTNIDGSTNFYVSLTVYTNAPLIVNDLPPQVTFISGKSYTYSIGVVGPRPYGYQWYNVTTPISNQTGSTYMATAGSPGSSTTYFVVVTNVYGATTSSVSTFASIAQLTNSYATNILQFNPVGYWPLQETNAPAMATMETNYGTLGAPGNAYYTSTNTSMVNFDQNGALAGDSD
ncbi:MAG: LamG-like jellyroll fold domain-containing protein, partial [Gammaproteobacteria bacterium]